MQMIRKISFDFVIRVHQCNEKFEKRHAKSIHDEQNMFYFFEIDIAICYRSF